MYSFTSTIRYSECDSTSHLTIAGLINYLQDCATFHTESIGHGISWCTSQGFAWFIAAWQIHIERLPRFTEDIRVTTWSFKKSPTLANRHFLIETAEGESLVYADSLWFPFDINRGRPERIPESEYVYLNDKSPLELPPTQRKLRLDGNSEACEPLVVTEHHLDSNNHVNNGQYVAMADSVVRAQDPSFALRSLNVQYKQAAKLGDTIVPRLYAEDTGYAVDLANAGGSSFAVVRMIGR